MATKLGPVDIPLRLDAAEAWRQVRLLHQRIQHTGSVGGFTVGAAGAAGAAGAPGRAGASGAAGIPGTQASGGFIPQLGRALQHPMGAPSFGGLYQQGMGYLPQHSVLGRVMRAGYTTAAIMQGIQTPLDVGVAALNAIPIYGGAAAFGAQVARLYGSVGAPVAKGMLQGLVGTGQIEDPAARQAIETAISGQNEAAMEISARVESWNESVKPAVQKMAAVAGLAGQVGGPLPVAALAEFGMRTFQIESSDNMLNRRFKQWRLQNGGEALGTAVMDVMKQSFAQSANR